MFLFTNHQRRLFYSCPELLLCRRCGHGERVWARGGFEIPSSLPRGDIAALFTSSLSTRLVTSRLCTSKYVRASLQRLQLLRADQLQCGARQAAGGCPCKSQDSNLMWAYCRIPLLRRKDSLIDHLPSDSQPSHHYRHHSTPSLPVVPERGGQDGGGEDAKK